MRIAERRQALLLVAALLLLVSLATPAHAQNASAEGPPLGWKWSVFVSDVFDDERAVGLRRRLFGAGALFVSGSYDRERRDFDGAITERTRTGVAYGYRHLLGSGRLKGLVEVEGRYSRDRIEADTPFGGTREGAGGGFYTGFEYFLGRSFSLSARVGVSVDRRDEAGGGDSRRTTALRPSVALNGYW